MGNEALILATLQEIRSEQRDIKLNQDMLTEKINSLEVSTAELNMQVQAVAPKVDKLSQLIIGNGAEGLAVKVNRLEHHDDVLNKFVFGKGSSTPGDMGICATVADLKDFKTNVTKYSLYAFALIGTVAIGAIAHVPLSDIVSVIWTKVFGG